MSHITPQTKLSTLFKAAGITPTVYKPSFIYFDTSDAMAVNDVEKLLGFKGLSYAVREVKGVWKFSIQLKTNVH